MKRTSCVTVTLDISRLGETLRRSCTNSKVDKVGDVTLTAAVRPETSSSWPLSFGYFHAHFMVDEVARTFISCPGIFFFFWTVQSRLFPALYRVQRRKTKAQLSLQITYHVYYYVYLAYDMTHGLSSTGTAKTSARYSLFICSSTHDFRNISSFQDKFQNTNLENNLQKVGR